MPTSRAGETGRAARGFTLIELMVVMAVAALLVTVALPLARLGSPGLEARAAARDIAAGLRRARTDAIFADRETLMLIDTDGRRWTIGEAGDWQALPEGLSLEVETARTEVLEGGIAGLRFFPDGSATGGRVTVSGETAVYHVMLDWLTGSVSIVQ